MIDEYAEVINATKQKNIQEEFNILKAAGEQLLKYRPDEKENLDILLNCKRYDSVDKNPNLSEFKDIYKEQDETLNSYSEDGGDIITKQANEINHAAFNVRRKHYANPMEKNEEEQIGKKGKRGKTRKTSFPDTSHLDDKKIVDATLSVSSAALSLMKERFSVYGPQCDEHAVQVQKELAEKERIDLELANRPLTKKQKVIKGFKNALKFSCGVLGKVTDHLTFEDSPKVKLTDAVKSTYMEVYKNSKVR